MIAHIFITPKPGILDPQGKAIGNALRNMGFSEVGEVKMGKYMTVELRTTPPAKARKRLEDMCRRLLANLNVESYRIEIGAD